MKYIFLILVTAIAISPCASQSAEEFKNLSTGQYLLDPSGSVIETYYLLEFFDSDKRKIVQSDDISGLDSLVERNGYVKLSQDSLDFIVTKRKPRSDLRMFNLLFQYEDLLILCNDTAPICDCGASTFVYSTSSNSLHRVEKAFSLSLKRNFIDLLEDLDKTLPFEVPSKDYKFCNLLEDLELE